MAMSLLMSTPLKETVKRRSISIRLRWSGFGI